MLYLSLFNLIYELLKMWTLKETFNKNIIFKTTTFYWISSAIDIEYYYVVNRNSNI